MKSILFFFFLLTMISTTSLVGANEEGKAPSCHLHISFGSYGSGTPHKIIKQIDAYLKKNKEKVKSQVRKNWGMEGEFDYCLTMTKASFKKPMFEDLKKIIPLESKKGYTILKSDDGKVHKTTWPK